MDVLSMRWDDLLFAHWDVEPDTVEDALPDRFDVDTYDGRAYIGVVPFVMRNVRPRGAPRCLGLDFAELNLRTYVRVDGEPGVYFFSLDADDALGVAGARLAYDLPYYRAETDVETDGDEVCFRSSRTHSGAPSAEFDATYRPTGDVFVADRGTLAEFVTERYAFFVSSRLGVVRGDVSHRPWRLRDAEAEIRENSLFEANGFEPPDGNPHLMYGEGIDVTASVPRRMSGV
ncbi:MAG: YqjF family protein [Halobacteriales archaeon]